MPDAEAFGSLLLLGLLLGMKHALEADHVAAVAALATRSRSVGHTVWQGVAWGAGHTLTLFVFGGLVLAVDAVVPARLAASLETAVGAMLVLLGLDVLRRLTRDRVHFHVHRHGGVVHMHAHGHAHDSESHDPARHVHPHRPTFPLRALLVGMMHGMAGTAALILLTVGGARTLTLGLAQIAAFGAGSIVGMAALSVVIAIPLRWSARALDWAHHGLQSLVGVTTLAVGGTILYHAGTQALVL